MVNYLPYLVHAVGLFNGAATAYAVTRYVATSSNPLTTSGLVTALIVVNSVFISIIEQQKWSQGKKNTCLNMALLIKPWSFASLANHISLQIPSLIKVYGIYYISSAISTISSSTIHMTLRSVFNFPNIERVDDEFD